MKTNIVDQFEILETIPYGLKRNQKTRDDVLSAYRYKICHMISLAQQAERQGHEVSIYLGKFDNKAFSDIGRYGYGGSE